MISYFVAIFFRIIYLIIIIVVLLSWIRIFDTRKEPLATIMKIYNIIMAPFKAVIPPIGMFDISPLIAIIVLEFIEQVLCRVLLSMGL
ncbi:MAG: YggT family protein [Candidatus Gastranaerophilales bacterium]|nr:YggT family protein [Candidatus Gastranaerophilales bacterium]